MYAARLSPTAAKAIAFDQIHVDQATDDDTMPAREQVLWALVIVLHIPLALLMYSQTILLVPQAGIAMALGIWWAMTNRTDRVAYAAAYIVGSEVLWRMTTDALWWESGKYGMTALFLVALMNRHGLRVMVAPVLCLALLVPSTFITINTYGIDAAKGILSFNLSGPLALATAAAYFSTLDLTPKQCQRLYFCLLAAVVAIGTIVLRNIFLAQAIHWTHESNRATSGNFGPNQVSLALGLGAFSALWCVFERGLGWPFRILLFAIVLWLGTQTALTFSRGGMIGAISAAVVAIGFLAGQAETRRKLLLAVPIVVCLAYFVIWPFLVDFTGGALAARYAEVGVTGRDKLTSEDIAVWYNNPFLGVGPGLSPLYHWDDVAAHTEFTRLLAEHGLFGLMFIIIMLGSGARNVIRAPSARQKGFVASALVWSLLFMLNAAMRTVAPSFMYGLSFNGCRTPRPNARKLPRQQVIGARRAAIEGRRGRRPERPSAA